jgi:hypothetical protein
MPFDSSHQMPASDLEVLVDARGHISGKNAWVKRRFQDGNRHCLVGALSLACGSPGFNVMNQTERRLARLLAEQLSPEEHWWMRLRFVTVRSRLMSFNDHPRTTHEDVLAVYDHAIHCLARRFPAPVLM